MNSENCEIYLSAQCIHDGEGYALGAAQPQSSDAV
jgi:hypothetical protein